MSIKEEVEHIIKKRWKGLKDPEELISQHSIERQTNEGYNGRQLLELFQNCEDEGASIVAINLNTSENKLEISNDGARPFSVKGYTSLFYPGLSSKVSSGFIGNKGLGFRSIINWAQKVSIISNDFELVFDKSLQRDTLIKKVGFTETELSELRQERKFKADVFPIPFLNCCRISDLSFSHKFTTTVQITYHKEFEKDIITQINSISKKTLLFLNHINTIQVSGDEIQKNISVSRTKINETTSKVVFNGSSLTVITDEGEVDAELTKNSDNSEPKKYSVKIAYNDRLTYSDNVLYNFFKTKIPFNFPFVAHASIELDQNRNHITESKVNHFILKKLLELNIRLVEKLKENQTKFWLPYLAIDKDNERIYESYQALIENVWNTLIIYPTISGKYENNQTAKNLSNSIAKFLLKNELGNCYPDQIVQIKKNFHPLVYLKKPKDYSEIIEKIGAKLEIHQRAQFIKIILQEYPDEKFSLLIDENENLIGKDDYVYTDKTSENKSLKVPFYSSIRFIHSHLYNKLILELSLRNELNKARALKEKLDKMSDVHSFEPMTVIRKLISETQNKLKERPSDKVEIIKEFYSTLFHNYKLREENPALEYSGLIPCLNKKGEITDLQSLVLSDQFEVVKNLFERFGRFYDEQYELIEISYLGLESEDMNEVQNFLLWLGINQHIIITSDSNQIDASFRHNIKKKLGYTPTKGELYWIKDFDKLLKREDLSITNLIAILYSDNNIQAIFSNFTRTHSLKETLKYHHYSFKNFRSFENLIYFKIASHYEIENYLITNKREEWFNPFKIDYEFLSKFNQDLDRNEVNRILTFFGGKADFNDLSMDYLEQKTNELAERNNPKGAQVFYKNLVNHFKKNQIKLPYCKLYARVENEIKVVDAQNIYFSDRIQLPNTLTGKFPIFYFPSRSGGTAAIDLFGLKDLNLLDLNIVNAPINEEIQVDFEKFLKEVKPFILAFRLDKITLENVKKNQVQLLNKLKIVCCENLKAKIEDEEFEIEYYNYVYDKNSDQFFIHVPQGDTISRLKQNKLFIDNLSDIFLKVFDTHEEKKTFVSILRQSYDDNLYDVNNELAEGLLEEAKVLLGEISVRLSIWRGIFNLKNLNIEILNEHNLDEQIDKSFEALSEYNVFYSDQNFEDLTAIRKIFQELQIKLSDYNEISDYKLSFDKLYQLEFTSYYNLKKKPLKNQVWLYASKAGFDVQRDFINDVYKIENLLSNYEISQKSDEYDFDTIILGLLSTIFDDISFSLEELELNNYDQIEKGNSKLFTEDELLLIRKSLELNSLNYFEGNAEYIRTQLSKESKHETDDFLKEVAIITPERDAEKVEKFEIVIPSKNQKPKTKPWLGNQKNELSPQEKKKLGNKAEIVIKEYLEKHTSYYSNIEHISKTDESAHFDIKYFDLEQQTLKYVECKYFNGSSFFISPEEKNFAEANFEQYEIWLVNKDKKIYCISDFNDLGELEPNNYIAHINIKDYAIEN